MLDLFETDAYFVVSSNGLITGTWTGLSRCVDVRAALGQSRRLPRDARGDSVVAAADRGGHRVARRHSPRGIRHRHGGDAPRRFSKGWRRNPFWVHGEVSVELDLPWPLPNVGATISLTWGGDDGEVPPGRRSH